MKNKEIVVFVSGNFNILHHGHLRLLRFAKECGDKLIVGINSDRLAKNNAHVKDTIRIENFKGISLVDEIILIDNNIQNIVRKIKPDIVVKGKEYENNYNEEIEALNEYGGKIVFSSGEAIISTFDLIQKELKQHKKKYDLPNDFLKRHSITFKNLRNIVNSFTKLKVLVIGDLIVDEYITCDPLGMSQEDPTIVVTPVDSKLYIGGAGIVAAHVAGLGAKVNFISIAGNDKTKDYAIKKLDEYNVNTKLFIDNSRPTTLKQRFRAKGKTLLRVSHLHQTNISSILQEQILKFITEQIQTFDLIIFSDFNYGCIPNFLLEEIEKISRESKVIIVADSQSSSQVGDISRFINMNLLTPTERETRLSLQDYDNGLVILAEKLRKKANAQNIILKNGEEGVLIHSGIDKDKWQTDRLPALNQEAIDVAGAGDSMLVATSLSLATGANIWSSICLGSIAAAIQVSRVGNIPLQYSEINEHIK
jgi:rfaE bifunctional protein kinase chain/domain